MAYISVIVPVYNVENILAKCLDSIIGQTFEDWEAVCVDDGSTDGSGTILDEYALKDSRIRVIHRNNGGAGAARNSALEEITGKYVLFVDSDDFIHPQLMDICHSLAETHYADIVAFTCNRTFLKISKIRNFLHLKSPAAVKFRKYDIQKLEYMLTDNIWEHATGYSSIRRWSVNHCQVWRCMYKASTIRDIRFLEGVIYEDFPWWSEVLLNTRNSVILNLPLYYFCPPARHKLTASDKRLMISSLKTCLEYADGMMTKRASGHNLDIWRNNFRTPFENRLIRTIKRYG